MILLLAKQAARSYQEFVFNHQYEKTAVSRVPISYPAVSFANRNLVSGSRYRRCVVIFPFSGSCVAILHNPLASDLFHILVVDCGIPMMSLFVERFESVKPTIHIVFSIDYNFLTHLPLNFS
jgi:hypothetical protein